MTALPGGAADKVGGQYEHWWTARVIGELLTGTASRLRLETPGPAGEAIEFEVDRDRTTWGEQVKFRAGNWTINRLEQEGLLGGALAQVRRGRMFRLIVSTTATPFDTLTNRSRDCVDLTEYIAALSSNDSSSFGKLANLWGLEQDEALVILRSIWVEPHPFENLRDLVAAEYRLLFSDDPTVVMGEVRNFCDDHMHEELTPNQLWSHLESKGFNRRRLAGDASSITVLRKTVERHARHVEANRPDIGLVHSGYVAELHDCLVRPDGKQLVVLDGPAGYGKSTIVAEVESTLQETGWVVAAANMTVVDPSAVTSTRLGDQLGLGDNSPGVLLAGVSDGSPGLMVLDQFDAVGTYSGRITAVYDAVSEVLAELAPTPNIKVLVVVRTVDLESDSRFRPFRDAEVADRIRIGKLTADNVVAKLSESGVPSPGSDVTLELLRTPLHLSIFLRLSGAAQLEDYPSLQVLYDRYTEEVRRVVEATTGHLAWGGIMSALVDFMNEHQRLSAPASIVDSFPQGEIHALESADVLSRSDAGLLSFFHESYFDYLFARMFVSSDKDLFEFIVESGQELFRRAQVRQVLEHLFATDRRKFRAVVQRMLASQEVRSHLKEVVVDVLGQVQGTANDWRALDEIAWSESRVAWRVLGLLSRPSWFAAVDSLGWWAEWLADPGKVQRAFHQLLFLARDHPERVVEIVRPYVGADDDWRLRFKSMIEWSIKPASTAFAIELIERGDLDDARGPIAVNSDFWSIVFGLAQEDPPSAGRLIGAYLNRGLVRAQAEGSSDPFESGHLPNGSQGDQIIANVATKAPREYLESVFDFVVFLARAGQQTRDGGSAIGRRWRRRYHHGYTVADKIFEGVAQALATVAGSDPELCSNYVARLSASDSDELHLLACGALTELGPADVAIAWLVDDPRNLELGYADSPLWASRSLIARWSSECSSELFSHLETVVVAYAPDWEKRSTGVARLRLLSALDASRLSGGARRQLGELERRFPGMELDRPPRGTTASFVGPPISDTAGEKMSDGDWMRALRKYTSEQTDWRGELPVGGAHELAQMLGRRARQDPERFAALALAFETDVHPAAMDAVLQAVTGQLDGELLADLCEHAQRTFGSDVGRAICWAVREADPISERMALVVASYVDDPDPEHELAMTTAGSGTCFYGGDLDSAGLNCTRGQVAHTASYALFQCADQLEVFRPVVQALAIDPILCVRAYAAEATLAIMNYEPQLAYDLGEELLQADIELYDSRGVERLMSYLLVREPTRFAPFLNRALAGPQAVAERAGHLWALLSYRESLPRESPQQAEDLSVETRRGVAEWFAHSAGESTEGLVTLFDDPDEEVRKRAASCMRYLESLVPATVTTLVKGFLPSKAFEECFDELFQDLEIVEVIDPELALQVCERAIGLAGADVGDIRTARSMMAEPVMVTLLKVYRQGDDEQQQRCLDVVDRLTEVNAHGLAAALDEGR